MNEYGKQVENQMNTYMENPNSIDEEIHDIQNARYGVEVRAALGAGVRKSFDKSQSAEERSNEAYDITQNLLDETFDSATLEVNFEQRLNDEIENMQPELNNQLNSLDNRLTQIATNVKTFGAMGDGATDDYEAIMDAIDYISVTGGTLFFPEGDYVFNQPIRFSGLKNISLVGQNSRLVPNMNTSFPFEINNDSENIKLYGLIFDGDNITSPTSSHLVTIRESKNITIEKCEFKNLKYGTSTINGNDGIYLRAANNDEGTHIYDVKIKDCRFDRISRNGVSIIQGERVIVSDCYFAVRRAGVDIEPNHNYELTKDVIVSDCVIDGRKTSSYYNADNDTEETVAIIGWGLEISASNLEGSSNLIENVIFKDNVIYGNPTLRTGNGLKISFAKNVTVENVKLFNILNSDEGGDNGVISCYRSETVTFSNTLIENYGDSLALRLYSSKQIKFNNCIIKNGDGSVLRSGAFSDSRLVFNQSEFINCGSAVNPIFRINAGVTLNNCEVTINDKVVSSVFETVSFDMALEIMSSKFLVSGAGKINYFLVSNRHIRDLKMVDCLLDSIGDSTIQYFFDIRSAAEDTFIYNIAITKNRFKDCKGGIRIGDYVDSVIFSGNQLSKSGGSYTILSFANTYNLLCIGNEIINDNSPRAIFASSTNNTKRIIKDNIIQGLFSVDVIVGSNQNDIVKDNITG